MSSIRTRASDFLGERVSARVRAYLNDQEIYYDPRWTCTVEALRAELTLRELPVFASAFELDASFGGIFSSPDETAFQLGTYQALHYEDKVPRYSSHADGEALRVLSAWPRIAWGSTLLLPAGHWHGSGDLYLTEEGALYGYQWTTDKLCAVAGSARALLEFIALWWETYEETTEPPRFFEVSVQASIAPQLAAALSAPLIDVVSDHVCARFQKQGLLIEGIVSPYPGGPRTTLWADLPVLVAALRIAHDLAPDAAIMLEQDCIEVSAALRASGLLPPAVSSHPPV